MSELLGFPFKDQLNSPTFDGRPDENSHMNCLCTCIACVLQYLTGKRYEPDEVKDAVYGESYTGGTAASMDVDYCAKQGIRLYPVNGGGAYLVEQVHEHLAAGRPVIGTIPSSYLPPTDPNNPGASHCIVFYKDSPGVLIAMNPWHAFAQANTNEWWAARFCFNQVWVAEKIEGKTVKIPSGWRDDGKALIAPNGKHIVMGFRNYVLSQNWNPEDVPLEDEHASPDGTEQLFSSVRLRWNKKQNRVYPELLGTDLLQAFTTISHYANEANDAHKQLTSAEATINTLDDELKKLEAVNEELHKELDAKEAAPPPTAPVDPAWKETLIHFIESL